MNRRHFLQLLGSTGFLLPFARINPAMADSAAPSSSSITITAQVLKTGLLAELTAHKHYLAYSEQALKDRQPAIAYLFTAFAVSEKIHADNYLVILDELGSRPALPVIPVSSSDTKTNLIEAASKELIKIEQTYPAFLRKLEQEGHDQAVISCMYSWKSHRQHQENLEAIKKYSRLFFDTVAERIEEGNFLYHVCEICGSTITEAPTQPCDICNYPMNHYQKISKPA